MTFYEKNKLAYSTLRNIKDDIVNSRDIQYNLTILSGLDKGLRYRIFLGVFTKEFNKSYKDLYVYGSCESLDLQRINNRKLAIIENTDLLNGNQELQNKIKKLLEICKQENIQVIFCIDNDIKDLKIDEELKRELLNGLVLNLER